MSTTALPARSATAVDVPLRYLATAAAALIAAAGGVAWLGPALAAHYYQPRVLALTHTVTLGWIMLAIMGASYQLIPVMVGRPVWSARLARWQFWILLAGISGMVAHFLLGTWPGLVLAAAMVGVGIALHLVNMLKSFEAVRAWTAGARLIALAHGGLALTALFGLTLGSVHVIGRVPARFFPTLHAHVHLALLGWVAPMVLGVGARVYPMFLLAPDREDVTGRLQLWGLSAGAPAVVAGLLVGLRPLVAAGALACAVAVGAHLAWLACTVRTARRPRLDTGLRAIMAGAVLLVAAALLGLAEAFDLVSGPRIALAYAVLALGGWASLTIAGMMLKIVPFLAWLHVYGRRAGQGPVPMIADLSWPAAERAAGTLLAVGVVALAAAAAAGNGAAIRVAGCVLLAGALALGAALCRPLGHLRRARMGSAPRAAAGTAPLGSTRS